MDFGDIKAALARLQSLVEGWESAGATELERDIALEELRRIYSEIRFGGSMTEECADAEPNVAAVPPIAVETAVHEENAGDDEPSDEPEIEVELIMPDEDEADDEISPAEEEPAETGSERSAGEPMPEDPAEKPMTEEPAEQQPEVPVAEAQEVPVESETTKENEPEEPAADETEQPKDEAVEQSVATTSDTAENYVENHAGSRKSEQSLFGDDEVVLPRSWRRRVIMSLYDDGVPTVVSGGNDVRGTEPKTEPAAELRTIPAAERKDIPESSADVNGESEPASDEAVEPVAIPEIDEDMVLGDVLRTDVHTLGESIARPAGIAESAPVVSLRSAIGINDRFLLIRDLFDGDADAYEKAIVAIDSFDNLDDCMVHIVENYSWRSSSDGAKLIMDLIQRKFRK